MMVVVLVCVFLDDGSDGFGQDGDRTSVGQDR